jgi:branched-chain amino acid transport system ATP-binding protein
MLAGAQTSILPSTKDDDDEGACMLAVRNISVRFGGLQALEAVRLDVRPGEVLGLIGPNGAGKTTLFNVICGFVRPDAGTVNWQDRDLAKIRPQQLSGLGIARTVQGLGLFANLTVLENVIVGADRHAIAGFTSAVLGLPRSDRDERELRNRARRILSDLRIEDVADSRPGTLPYPIQKRVALARALAAEPQLLMLDEPAAGLSEADLVDLAELIRELRGRMAVMLVEHHMELVMGVCDRIVVLDFGRVIASGTPAEIRADPAVLDAYLGGSVSGSPDPAGRR